MMKTTTLAIAAVMAAGTVADAQDADCNVNGIPDSTEIAQGLADDCNANGIPDACEYAGVTLEAEQSGFGSSSPLIATFTDVDLSLSDVRLEVSVRADLDSVGEFVQVKVGGAVVSTLWVTGGQPCPSEVQSQTVLIPAATFNTSIANATVVISLEPSGVVSVKECPSSFASLAAEYISNALPADCFGSGAWDGCDISADPSLDCDGNGLIDSCEIDGEPSLDCDGNGNLDACDLASDPLLDCDANGSLDACDIASTPSRDCDSNGQLDSCEIAAEPSLDCSGNGILNSCEILLGGTYFNYDCDGNGVNDVCQINAAPSLDKNDDGLLDTCQYARGDFDLDRTVGGADLALLLGLWGTANPPIGDITRDGMINGADLAELLGNWGEYAAPWGATLEVLPDPAVVMSIELRDRIIATGLPWRVRDNASQIEMLLVPPGAFMMGCSPSNQHGCSASENPVHEVTLTRAFYLGRYEVTQAQWTAVMGSNPSSFQSPSAQVPAEQVPSRPVEQVSWNMIQGFEAETGLRLPTEAEWEYACRAGTPTAFNLPPNGTNEDELAALMAWYSDNSASQTHPVGNKLANDFGLFDTHGNVWEFVEDFASSTYYANSPVMDPPGPRPTSARVMRGGAWGGWATGISILRSSARASISSAYTASDNTIGFRAARTP